MRFNSTQTVTICGCCREKQLVNQQWQSIPRSDYTLYKSHLHVHIYEKTCPFCLNMGSYRKSGNENILSVLYS